MLRQGSISWIVETLPSGAGRIEPTREVMSIRQRIEMYEATVARLEKQVEGLALTRKRLRKTMYIALALSPIALFIHPVGAVLALIAVLSLVGVGHYIAYIHEIEDRGGITQAKAELERMRSQASGAPQSPEARSKSA